MDENRKRYGMTTMDNSDSDNEKNEQRGKTVMGNTGVRDFGKVNLRMSG
jgi:hypothetical protein